MHELGIAQNILQIVQQSVPPEQAADVRKIRLKIGKLSGVVAESLDFCFNVMIGETEMKRAVLEIEHVPIMALCRECGNRFPIDELDFTCSACKSTQIEMLSGKELEIVEIELEDGSESL
jgi:hydrogenase nickel incorporation protein HypA/HybF